jgi:hypothetical protein
MSNTNSIQSDSKSKTIDTNLINKIIYTVIDLNKDFYKFNDYSNKEVIESLIVYICRKHAKCLEEDSQYLSLQVWTEKEISVTDGSDIDIDLLLEGEEDEEYIKNRVKICNDCLNKSEIRQKMEDSLKIHFPWLNKIRHSDNCNMLNRESLKDDICNYIRNKFSLFESTDRGYDFEDFVNDSKFTKHFNKILTSYEESIRKKSDYKQEDDE